MGLLASLRRILNDTAGTATDIDFNFQSLESFVNTEVVNRDGSVAMTAPLVGVPAVNNNEYATLAQISGASGVIPIASVFDYGGDTAPPGFVLCDGQAYSSTDPTYEALFAVIGYKFGDAGGGNFRVPDLRTKVAVGAGSGFAVGATGGTADAVLPTHTHTATLTGGLATSTGAHVHNAARPDTAQVPQGDGSSGNRGLSLSSQPPDQTGFGGTHSHTVTGTVTVNEAGESPTNRNFPPYVVHNYIIKV